MEEGQRPTDDSHTESGGCTPAECRRKHNDGDMSSDAESVERAGIDTANPHRVSEEAGMEEAENKDADEESDGLSDGTDEEEGDGIQDISQLGAGAVAVKFQTGHQQSYQLVGKVTQYNLIQVQQQFGDVTVKGGNNLNIGGTQNISTTPTIKEEEEIPLTAAQKIRKRTTSRIQSWTNDMVETDVLKKVKEKLDRGATWVTIKGRPGEGKSTIAYMALKYLHSQGRQVYQVVSPEEFNEVTMACVNPVIMLDDIFGDLEFDTAEWSKWRPSLRPIVDVKHPDTYAEKDLLDVSTKTEKVSERTKIDQRQVKRTSPNKDETIIILVGRDYVLKSSLADLGRMADYISSPQYVVEVSSQRGSYERKKIWRVHAETKNIDIDESTESQICEADCPHGFPHVCKMFVAAFEKDRTQLQMFFQAPLDFLRKTLDKFLKDKIKRSLFMAMIKRDGKISEQDLEEDDSLGYECIAAADDLVGSYLKKEEDTYMFDHPSIYDSVSFILSKKQPKFVIENCSLSFINQRLRLAHSSKEKKEKNLAGDTDLVANISWTYAERLARRFASEMQRGNLLHVLSHQSLCYSDFVDLLMDCLKTRFHMRVSDIVKLTDKSSNKSFCELLSSSKSHHLIKYIMERENLLFTQSERRDILLGVCTNAACDILKYISGHMELDINATYGREEKTPLMLAAETRNNEFVNQILSLHPDLNARDKSGQMVFKYLCVNGLTSAVEHANDKGVEVNQYQELSLLYTLIEKGHLEVVKVLVNRGCDIDNQKGLRCAVGSLNANMVRYFLDRGAVGDCSVVCRACEVGNRNIVEMLFENGAPVDMESPDGETPLLHSCKGNPTAVSYLLTKGASVNQVSDVTGDTPFHTAAMWGSTESVDVLQKAGADVNVQNNAGDTPLHIAARLGYTERVDVLLKAAEDVNVQNNDGDTPLHIAARRWGSTDCADVLLKAGADVNVQNNTGDTPLHTAEGQRSAECVAMLLKAGADLNVQNNTDDTPLHIAAMWRSTKCVVMLLKAGANVNVKNCTGDTPLHTAARRRCTKCADELLKTGANINVQNNTGDTPLHIAAGRVSTERVDVLLKYGADVNVLNDTGDTPLDIAARRGFTEIVDVILKAGADLNVHNNKGDTPLLKATV
ncbi:uncharacterized protein LOC124269596 isoform X2 [Haliotis rubra]|uniref:uncharacterized protein LOC124269596 isoform X2 n=1 Tax=Haliotis rubra TaxID=36100 RepID=UPI001EE5D178|nr:uncharacterized protein LOC124269596 isoform X2 [Haliotis rubra]